MTTNIVWEHPPPTLGLWACDCDNCIHGHSSAGVIVYTLSPSLGPVLLLGSESYRGIEWYSGFIGKCTANESSAETAARELYEESARTIRLSPDELQEGCVHFHYRRPNTHKYCTFFLLRRAWDLGRLALFRAAAELSAAGREYLEKYVYDEATLIEITSMDGETVRNRTNDALLPIAKWFAIMMRTLLKSGYLGPLFTDAYT